MVSLRRWPFLIVPVTLNLVAIYGLASALPVGKAWAPTSRFTLDTYVSLSAPRLDFDGSVLRAVAEPRGGGPAAAVGLRWTDSVWVERWRLSYPTNLFGPVVSLDRELHLVWLGDTDPDWTTPPLMMSRWVGDALARIDTVTRTTTLRTEYSACASLKRRWVAVSDLVRDASGQWKDTVRLFYSDNDPPAEASGIRQSRVAPLDDATGSTITWHEIIAGDGGEYGVAIASVDDTTAIAVWASTGPNLQWGVLSGTQWLPKGILLSRSPIRPRMRLNPDGSVWLSWGALDQDLHLALYKDGAWGPQLKVSGVYPRDPQSQNFVYDSDLSKDASPTPVVVWDASYSTSSQILVAFPAANGYSIGEFVPGSYEGVLPSVVRDQYGDVWITWWQEYQATWWTHTYTRATASTVQIKNHGPTRTLAWTLTEPAPGSWWTVLRSRNGDAETSVARVQAGDGTLVTWTDNSLAADNLKYRVRRDCLDTRYIWTSSAVAWPVPLGGLQKATVEVMQNTSTAGLPLELRGMTVGTAMLELFDLQGRRVLEQAIDVASESQPVSLPVSQLRVSAGIYFAQVRDAEGERSTPSRILVLK